MPHEQDGTLQNDSVLCSGDPWKRGCTPSFLTSERNEMAKVHGRSREENISEAKKEIPMLLLIIVLVLLFGGGGGYYGYSRWGAGGGMGIVGTILLIVLLLYLFGGLRI